MIVYMAQVTSKDILNFGPLGKGDNNKTLKNAAERNLLKLKAKAEKAKAEKAKAEEEEAEKAKAETAVKRDNLLKRLRKATLNSKQKEEIKPEEVIDTPEKLINYVYEFCKDKKINEDIIEALKQNKNITKNFVPIIKSQNYGYATELNGVYFNDKEDKQILYMKANKKFTESDRNDAINTLKGVKAESARDRLEKAFCNVELDKENVDALVYGRLYNKYGGNQYVFMLYENTIYYEIISESERYETIEDWQNKDLQEKRNYVSNFGNTLRSSISNLFDYQSEVKAKHSISGGNRRKP